MQHFDNVKEASVVMYDFRRHSFDLNKRSRLRRPIWGVRFATLNFCLTNEGTNPNPFGPTPHSPWGPGGGGVEEGQSQTISFQKLPGVNECKDCLSRNSFLGGGCRLPGWLLIPLRMGVHRFVRARAGSICLRGKAPQPPTAAAKDGEGPRPTKTRAPTAKAARGALPAPAPAGPALPHGGGGGSRWAPALR